MKGHHCLHAPVAEGVNLTNSVRYGVSQRRDYVRIARGHAETAGTIEVLEKQDGYHRVEGLALSLYRPVLPTVRSSRSVSAHLYRIRGDAAVQYPDRRRRMGGVRCDMRRHPGILARQFSMGAASGSLLGGFAEFGIHLSAQLRSAGDMRFADRMDSRCESEGENLLEDGCASPVCGRTFSRRHHLLPDIFGPDGCGQRIASSHRHAADHVAWQCVVVAYRNRHDRQFPLGPDTTP
jgi:hypothetical protein